MSGTINSTGEILINGLGTSTGSVALSDNSPSDVGSTAAGSGTTASRYDHTHKGVHSLTAASALYGDVTLAAGTNVTLSQAGQVITIASGSTASAHTYLGYNTAGASFETMTAHRVYLKQIYVSASGIINSIGAYIRRQSGQTLDNLSVSLYSNSGSSPFQVIGLGDMTNQRLYLNNAASQNNARWFQVPLGTYVTSGSYFIGVSADFGIHELAYDAGGNDVYFTTGGYYPDGNYYNNFAISRNYSIRADFAGGGASSTDYGGVVSETSYGLTATAGTSGSSSRNDHSHGSPSLSTASPVDVASTAAAGSGTTPSKNDHVHKGLHSAAVSGQAQIFGDLTFVQGSNITLTQTSGSVTVTAASGGTTPLSSTLPEDIASAAVIGTSGSAARSDHVHKGVHSVATSGSPALYGDVVLAPGTNISLSQVSNIITITSGSAGGGGGITQAYVGYNTVGGSTETPGVNSKVYAKKVTLATACLMTSIGAYLSQAGGNSYGPAVAVYSDSSGPDKLIACNTGPGTLLYMTSGARWVELPIGVWLTAGDYWIAVRTTDLGASALCLINYDGSGSDQTATGLSGWYDWSNYSSPVTTSNRYSIRANTIR